MSEIKDQTSNNFYQMFNNEYNDFQVKTCAPFSSKST